MAEPPDRVNTVLFDLDDTLLDSYKARIQAVQDVFTLAKITDITPETFIFKWQGVTFNKAFEKLAAERNIKDDLFVFYRRAYWFNKGRIRLYPGIKEMLQALQSRDYKLGIVTNKGRNFEFEGRYVGCIEELREVGIHDYFSTVIGFEDVKEGKPHPEGVIMALNQLKSKPQETLFVGDSTVDIQVAYNTNCRSCYATWGLSSNLPKDLKAHYTINAPRDLLALDCF
jgi:HAD superfamily hydrolase (TIGR01549 family)